MEATEETPRVFPLPFDSITMSERRIMASKFGVNWDAVELDLSDIPRPEDPENATDDEKKAVAKGFTRVIGPNERFAMLFIAVKRQIPTASEAQIEQHADAGDWVLGLGTDDSDGDGPLGEELPPPTSSSTS